MIRSLETASTDTGMLPLTIDLISLYLKNNAVPSDAMGSLVSGVHSALLGSARDAAVVDDLDLKISFLDRSTSSTPTDESVAPSPVKEEEGRSLSSLMSSLGLTYEKVRHVPRGRPPELSPASAAPEPETPTQAFVEPSVPAPKPSEPVPAKAKKAASPSIARQAELPFTAPPQPAPKQAVSQTKPAKTGNRVLVNGHPLPLRMKTTDDAIQMKHIICLEDGKKVRDLAEHLKQNHKMTPSEYKKKWGLPSEYPMQSPNAILSSAQVFEVDFTTGTRRKI